MPCLSDYSEPYTNYVDEKMKKELDRVTRLLCFLMGTSILHMDVDIFSALSKNAPDLMAWWDKHKESDEKRLVKEMKAYLKNRPNATKKEVVDLFIKRAEKVHAVSEYHRSYFFPSCFDLANKEQDVVDKIKSKLDAEEYEILKKHFKNA